VVISAGVGICLVLGTVVGPGALRIDRASAATASPPYLTLLSGRTQGQASDDCTAPLPNTLSLEDVATRLQSRGLSMTAAVVTSPTDETVSYCQPGIGYAASWQELEALRDDFGWSAVSTGAQHLNMTTLTPEQQDAESCGSIAPLADHGFPEGNGLFGYGNDKYTDQIQADVVSQCFDFGRRYVTPTSPEVNTRPLMTPPWFAWTLSVNGGACNDTTLSCYDQSALGVNRRYMSPTYIASVMNTLPDQWAIVQTYRFVTGSHAASAPDGSAWDCTDPDWAKHWTNRAELYCIGDYETALDQLSSTVTVTDPASVYADWGHEIVPADTTGPTGTVAVPTVDQVLPHTNAAMHGSAADDVAVAAVEVYVKDRNTDLIWQPDGTWSTKFAWQRATLSAPGDPATDWSYVWPGTGGDGQYSLGMRVKDTSGNIQGGYFVRFVTGSVDVTPPNATIETPAQDHAFVAGPIAMHGLATDDVGVAGVEVYVKDRDSGLIWQPDGSWTSTFTWNPTTLGTPGAPSTTWSFDWPGVDAAANLSLGLRVQDTAGNLHSNLFSRFTVLDPSAAGTTPRLVRVLGGPLHYEMYPSGLEIAPDGTVVVADTGNNEVKKYDRAGNLIWAVGTYGQGVGEFYEPRDVAVASTGEIFVIDTRNSRIVKLDADGNWLASFDGPANDKISFPLGLTVHDDQLVLADLGKKKVRLFDLDGAQVQAFGTNGACANLNGIRDADRDSAGNFYVAGYSTNQILKFGPTGTCIKVWGTTGSGDGQFRTPYGVRIATDPVLGTEAVYVADALNNRVQEFTLDGAFVTKFGTSGSHDEPGTLETLRRVAVDTDGSGAVWVADLWGNRIARWDRTPTGYQFGSQFGATPPASNDTEVFHEPRQVAFNADGTLNVADTVHHRIIHMSPTGQLLGSCGQRGSAAGQFNWPRGVAVDPATNQMWVADTKANRIEILNADCTVDTVFGSNGAGPTQFNWPYAVAIRNDGIAFVVDTQNHRIKAYDTQTRQLLGTFGSVGPNQNQFRNPAGIAVSPVTGNIFVADTNNNRLVEIATTDGISFNVVRYIAGYFAGPEGLAIDAGGRIFATNSNDDNVVILTPTGTFDQYLETPQMNHPASVSIGPDGLIYVSDTFNDRVLVYRQVRFVKTLAGPSIAAMYPSGFEWDATQDRIVVADTGRDRILFYDLDGSVQGGFGTSGSGDGEFSSPRDVAVDESGNIYVADAGNNRIEKYDPTGSTLEWTVGGTGTCDACLNTPIGVTWDSANDVLLVASTGQSLIKAFQADGSFAWKSPTGAAAGFASPRDVARGPDGRIWVADYKHHQIAVYDVAADGSGWNPAFRLGDGAAGGHGDEQLNFPYNVAWSPDGTVAYVADTGNDRIARWDLSSGTPQWMSAIGTKCAEPCPDDSPGEFEHLRRVAVTSDGTVLGADFWGSGIQVFEPDGSVVRQIEGAAAPTPGVAGAFGVATSPAGETYVVDRLNQRVEHFDADDQFVSARGSRGVGPGRFSWPEAAAVAPDGTVWVADTRSDRLQHFAADLSGTPTSVGDTGDGVGFFNYPEGLTVDATGKVWVADTRNDRIQTFDPTTASFATIGGAGTGPGQFAKPQGVAVTATALYVADTDNDRIQKLSLNGSFLAQSTLALHGPEGIVVAPDGTVWVADTQNHRIVHLSSDLVDLGDGFGHHGDGDLGFDRPHSLAVRGSELLVADTYNDRVQVFDVGTVDAPVFDPLYSREISDAGGVAPLYPAGGVSDTAGVLYVADSGGSRIAKIDTDGTVTTVLGAGLNDPRDLARDGDGTLWLTDTSNSAIKHIDTSGSVLDTFGGPSTFKTPYGLDADADAVYVADTYNMRVVALDKGDGSILWEQSTCFGVDFSRPRDVGLGSDGDLYVADTDNDRIAVVDPDTGGCLREFGTTGSGNGQFKSPRAVTADPSGDGIWVADAFNYRIQHLGADGSFVAATSAGFGAAPGQFRSAHCVFADAAGGIVACDTFNNRLQRYDVDGAGAPVFDRIIGGTAPSDGGFNGAFDAAYGPSGELYVLDWFNHRVEKFAPDGSFELAWGGYGSGPGSLIFPRGIEVSADGGTVVVTDSENNRIDLFGSDGTFIRSVKPVGTNLSRPHQSALAPDGTFWVADTNNDRVLHLSSTGDVLAEITNGGTIDGPRGIALSSAGNVYVSNTANNRVEAYSPDGSLLATIATNGAGPGKVSQPHGLRIADVGGSEKLFVTDNNDRVSVFGLTGEFVTTFGSSGDGPGELSAPNGVGVNPSTGEVAVADWGNNRVSIWTTTIAGPPDPEPTPDTTAPDGSVTTPTEGQFLTLGSLTFSGTASDDVGVESVRLGIKNVTTGEWWQANGTWGASYAALLATLGSPGGAATTWDYSWTPPEPGDYALSVGTRDLSGNTDATRPWVRFTVSPGGPDTTAPNGSITTPTKDEVIPVAPYSITGTANDDGAVAGVFVAIQDRSTLQWWTGSGWGTYTTLPATLANPGAATTTWSYAWTPPAAGSYGVLVRVDDAAGNTIASKPWVRFTAG
jgi:DNA-binding beta-propeller fold protein YncE